jgi:hypothetical protein
MLLRDEEGVGSRILVTGCWKREEELSLADFTRLWRGAEKRRDKIFFRV